MGIDGINPELKKITNAYFTLPYELLANEHVVYDGSEMIYRYVNRVFKNIRYSNLPDEARKLNHWKLVNWLIAQYWDKIISEMMRDIRRFPSSTYITFVMDGSDTTGKADRFDALGGMFDIKLKQREEEVIFTNFEESSDDLSDSSNGEDEDKLGFVYVDSGNIVPTVDTAEMKADTWTSRESSKQSSFAKIKSGEKDILTGIFCMTPLSKLLINDLIDLTTDRNLGLIYADGEADFLIALYCNERRAFGCVTKDADQLAYGSDLHITFATSKGLEIRYTPFILEDLDINEDQLRSWCILLGCDYNTRIKGMGPKTSFKVIKGERDLPSEKDLTMIAQFDKCWDVFSSAQGYSYIEGIEYFASRERVYERIESFVV